MPISNITISNTFGQFRQAFNDSANAINSLPASIVTNVGAISPVASSGGSTPSIGLNSAYGDSQNPYASKTANHVLAAPNAASGFPSFRALVANDIPTILNAIATANVTANNLTSGRVAIVGASGIIQDDAGMTYNPTTDVLTLSGGTDAANSTSGTLVVSGGVGIGKNLHVSGNTFISGNLVILGSNTELSTTQINVNDPLIQLANNNTSDLIDIGVFGQYNSGAANLHSGIFRDATDGVWKLFNSYSAEPTTTINPAANNFAYADLNVNSLTAFSNVGIGTSSPGAKLDVNGGTNSEMRVTTSGSGYLQIGQFTNGAYVGTSSTDATAGVLRLGTGGSERARIDSSGNFGLGVTPSAWVGGVAKTLQVGDVASLYTLSDDRTVVGSNVYYDGTSYKYIKTAYASQYVQLNSQHIWLTAPSGTAGNAITFTQAMTLDASGLLTVGNTSPAGSSQITAYGAFNGQIAVQNSTNWSRLVQNSGDLYIDNGVGGSAGNIIFRNSSSTLERMRLDSSGNLLVGGTAARGTTVGTAHLDLFNGTAPAGTLTNGVSLYSSSGDLKFMDAAGNAYDVGFRNIPQNSQSAAYTLVLSDAGKHILHPASDANARTYTIPANSSVAYPIGTAITFINMASQVVTIAITTDTMYLSPAGTTGSRSLAQYGSATAIKMTSTTWLISGSGLT